MLDIPSYILGKKASGGGSDNYSTTEQVVGTWIDGKPLYRVVIQDTVPNYSSGTPVEKNINCSTYNIETLIKQEAFCKTTITGGFDFMDLPILESNPSQVVRTYYHTNAEQLTLSSSSSVRNGATVFITLEYTKTTD